MTKNFCDICGRPACENGYVRVQINAGEPWTGYRSNVTGPGGCDGTFQPVVRIEAVIQLENGRKPASQIQNADICALCRSRVLTELMMKYAVPDLLP